jgi:hypothetical protein
LSFLKTLLIGSIALFSIIGVLAFFKQGRGAKSLPKTEIVQVKPLPSSKPVLRESGEIAATDRISELFSTGDKKLPIVETIAYESSVPWMKGRPAWLGDYASYYATSRHFIARSLNGKADYLTQKVSPGKLFNVFRKDKNFQFYLLVDKTRCKMAFYYIDLNAGERVLLKTYSVGVGKGGLTPSGRYQLGDKIAVYQPGVMGLYRDK